MIENLALDVIGATLSPWPLPASDIIAGKPEVSGHVIVDEPDRQIGIWQITPGTVRDVEAEELFVILEGRATVEIEGGSVLELAPGTVGTLREGTRTVWHVRETLRKIYCLKPRPKALATA